MEVRSRDPAAPARGMVAYRLFVAMGFTLVLALVGPALEVESSALAVAVLGLGSALGVAHRFLQGRIVLGLSDRDRVALLLVTGVLVGALAVLLVPPALYPSLTHLVIGYAWGVALLSVSRYARSTGPPAGNDV